MIRIFLRTAAGMWMASVIAMGASPAHAQQASQHGSVAQTVNRTVITLEYDRPVARGRELFGGIVDWDAIWTPGANVATWIEFSESVTFEGHDLEAGMFPFDAEVFRTTVAPQQGAHMETLGFYFPVVGPYEATLRLHWGTTIVPLRIEVPR